MIIMMMMMDKMLEANIVVLFLWHIDRMVFM